MKKIKFGPFTKFLTIGPPKMQNRVEYLCEVDNANS
ncbi:hypothetical protein SOVF_185100 [Spinacia oleracea]|nr:hypothetical protein SOVF_185100 [Spinacia oleracea]